MAQGLPSQPLDYQVIKEASPSQRPKFKVHLATQEGYQAANPRGGVTLTINTASPLH